MHGLQIWVNLPKKNKKAKPSYQHIFKDDIPTIKLDDDKIIIKVLVGSMMNTKSKINTYSSVSIFDTQFIKPGTITLNIPKDEIAISYIIDGELQFTEMNKIARKGQMVYFDQESDFVNLTSISSKGSYLILTGIPLNEPIARQGPFVANTNEEIKQAILDYQNDKMGKLK